MFRSAQHDSALLNNETFRPLKILELGRQLFNRARRHSTVKLIRLSERFVHQRFGADYAKIRQSTATQDYAICSDKTIVANPHRLRSLAVFLDVDTVGHDLRLKSGHSAELPNRDRIRAIDEMPMGDRGMFAHNQLRLAICLFGEMTRRPERKAGDPIAPAPHRVCFEVKQIESFAKRQVIDSAPLFHDQARWIDPGQSDSATWMNLVTELFF